jgi:hypothetical protein
MTRFGCVGSLMLLSIAPLAAGQPQITNGRVESRAVATTLEREVRESGARQSEPLWIGYGVPAREGDDRTCCWSGDRAGDCCTGCRLEPGVASAVVSFRQDARPIPLERGDMVFVLYRVEKGEVDRIRMFSEDCPLDAGGRVVQWLTGVREEDSVSFLSTFLSKSASNPLVDSALAVLAMHRAPAALDRLLTSARDGATTHLRGQALFWLAHRAGDQAVQTISNAIANDPETEVKRRAVFALSQLPKDQGVPLLIQLARTNANPAVRKQAMFWLGQSGDPRALEFFREILFK